MGFALDVTRVVSYGGPYDIFLYMPDGSLCRILLGGNLKGCTPIRTATIRTEKLAPRGNLRSANSYRDN